MIQFQRLFSHFVMRIPPFVSARLLRRPATRSCAMPITLDAYPVASLRARAGVVSRCRVVPPHVPLLRLHAFAPRCGWICLCVLVVSGWTFQPLWVQRHVHYILVTTDPAVARVVSSVKGRVIANSSLESWRGHLQKHRRSRKPVRNRRSPLIPKRFH